MIDWLFSNADTVITGVATVLAAWMTAQVGDFDEGDDLSFLGGEL